MYTLHKKDVMTMDFESHVVSYDSMVVLPTLSFLA